MRLHELWSDDSAQDIAEYAMMLAILLITVIVVIQAIGTNALAVFSRLAVALKSVV
jgi:Flp pilus assembly pilin Flp